MKAYKFLQDPNRWVQSHEAEDSQGKPCNADDPIAVKFCVAAAIHRCYGPDPEVSVQKVGEFLQINEFSGPLAFFQIHDHPETTHADVIAWLKKANI